MKKLGFICILFLSQSLVAQQILPGTWSLRTGPDGTVGTEAGVSDYYSMTGWDSSPYQQFRFHKGQSTPGAGNFWLNFRLLFPEPYDNTPSQKYPMIVMLHGLGEAGIRGTANFPAYDPSDPRYLNNDHSLYHTGYSHLEAVTSGEFPGFVLAPQNTTLWSDDNIDGVIAIIEELLKNYPIDPYRIYLHGYSNGGDGVWKMAEKRPDLFAAMLPMSWVNFEVDPTRLIHIPTWYFQGEQDENPTVEAARYMINLLEETGGTPRYTEYVNGGHAIWFKAYDEPDFFSWMLGRKKTEILAYYGRTSVCPNEEVNIRLGLSPGFASYQWRVTDQGSTETFSAGGPDNFEFIAQKTGDYQVRVSRKANPTAVDWSPWSDPLSITVQEDIIPPDIVLDGSPHLPSPDGRSSAVLSIPDDYQTYQWFRNGSPMEGSTDPVLQTSQQGNYHVAVSLAESCPAIYSDTVKITTNAATNPVNKPQELAATAISEVAIRLDWTDASNNETGFEVYRSGSPGGPFALVKTLPANSTGTKDSALRPSTTYYYKLRAFNRDNPSALSNLASARTLADTVPPTVPGFLNYELLDTRTVRLFWSASTDNSNLIIYDIIVNGTVVGSTSDLTYTLNGLNEETIYTVFVRARDRAGNRSGNSNQAAVKTVFEGVTYKYYYGGLWEETADYNGWPVDKQGYLENVNIDTEQEGGVRPNPQVNYFAFDFEGYLFIRKGGRYIFSLEAAAGSVLQVGSFILNNDGKHGPATVTGNVKLKNGPVRFLVKYYDRTEEEVLKIYYSGPDTGNELIPIPEEMLTSSLKNFPDPPMAPTDFHTTDILPNKIDLEWMDESDNETGFEILRSDSVRGPYAKVTTVPRNASAYSNRSVAPLRTYHYLVRAINKSGGSEFDSLTATSGLPLSEFSVECGSEGNRIAWTSALPWTGQPYVVERSADMEESTIIGRIDSDTLGSGFDWVDNAFIADTTFYRIGQLTAQGGIGYSQWVSSACIPVDFKLMADIYPVPVTGGFLTIRMRTMLPDTPVNIRIIDTMGRILLDTTIAPDPLKSPYSIDVSNIARKGLYIVFIHQADRSFQQKIIVQN